MGTHEELFALLDLVTDPKTIKANLDKLDAARKAAVDERKAAEAANTEASANNAAAKKSLADANEVAAKAAEDRKAAQDRKDKADLALGQATALNEKLKGKEAELAERERTLKSGENALATNLKGLAERENEVAALKTELQTKLAQLKKLTA